MSRRALLHLDHRADTLQAQSKVPTGTLSIDFPLKELEAEFARAAFLREQLSAKLVLKRSAVELSQRLGFVVEEDPRLDARLRSRIQALSEDGLLELVVLPLLERMGFEGLRKVRFHGREEFGRDVTPFRRRPPLSEL